MPRNKRDQVRLYSEEGRYLIHVTKLDAENMLVAGTHEHAYETRPNGEVREIGIQPRTVHKDSNNISDCSLTEFDMQANVGITGGEIGDPAVAGIVAAAQVRVECWPFIGDTKAVRVSPRI